MDFKMWNSYIFKLGKTFLLNSFFFNFFLMQFGFEFTSDQSVISILNFNTELITIRRA